MAEAAACYLALSRAIAGLPRLPVLLGGAVARTGWLAHAPAARGVLAWGKKPSAVRAERYAQRHGLPLIRLEDGFLRSIGLGSACPPLSIVVDDVGIYYDATAPSRLEVLVSRPLGTKEVERAQRLRCAWQRARVSKYNQARESQRGPEPGFVLVIDQTFGDAAIRFGMANEASFRQMLEAAVDDNPGRRIILKVHPEVVAGRKRGHFDRLPPALAQRVRIVGDESHPVGWLEGAAAVYTVTSQVGFEALLWGTPVRCFGMPFYAGWGLTADALPAPDRRKPVLLEQLVHAALIDYARYVDPETGAVCGAERLIEWMGLQRRMRERLPAAAQAVGFSMWKRPLVRLFMQGCDVRFSRRQTPDAAVGVVWGRKPWGGNKGPVLRLEDGFIRSVGLGADLVRPLSWVVDGRGMYYDATRPSDLEHLLQNHVFQEEMLIRAARLRERLVATGLTKYNVGGEAWSRPHGAANVILVPGQVETDASLALGAPGLRRNMDLLKAVREARPDAWIVYKPHPDVVARLRREGAGEEDARRWCDEVVTAATMGQLLEQVDEVHVMTSLAGFEALLRGRSVTCYGQPFYSGWGLTCDRMPVQRRTRKLSLDELIAGALIEYPTYVSRVTGRYTTPERALDELLAWKAETRSVPQLRRLLRWVLSWRRN